MWIKGGLALKECPRAFITGDSLSLLEEFYTRKQFGFGDVFQLPARTVEAFQLLEREMEVERVSNE